MYYVYVLFSEKDRKLYIGYSADLKTRIENHLKGKVEITKNRLPLKLVYYEAFINEMAARKQELFYKTGQGRRVLKNRLEFLTVDSGEVA
ncbi:MAG: GIY-YIG nuclease family protein [Patescibacteria group bacterium]